MLVLHKVRGMVKKRNAQKLFEPGGIGYKIAKRFTLAELQAAARVLHVKRTDDKRELIANIVKTNDKDYKAICEKLNMKKSVDT